MGTASLYQTFREHGATGADLDRDEPWGEQSRGATSVASFLTSPRTDLLFSIKSVASFFNFGRSDPLLYSSSGVRGGTRRLT